MAKKLFIGNISWGIKSDQLREAFAEFGDIEDAVVLEDKFTGRSRGFGFVTFTNDEDGDKAVEAMHEKELDGRELVVNEARPRD
ncbi:RNA-binding protein [Candidatus Gracilibacteria bacterium]|nr:RNA-binding protein [Candidatus Gracilibacteria bacterium]